MRDTDLYRQVLALEKPWTVERVDLDVAGHRVDIWVEHKSGAVWNCPRCGRELSCRQHAEERVWRHGGPGGLLEGLSQAQSDDIESVSMDMACGRPISGRRLRRCRVRSRRRRACGYRKKAHFKIATYF
jgi:hypothetical protein